MDKAFPGLRFKEQYCKRLSVSLYPFGVLNPPRRSIEGVFTFSMKTLEQVAMGDLRLMRGSMVVILKGP